MKPFRVVPAHHYPLELEEKLYDAKKRIVITAMILYADDTTAPLFTAIEAALRRGVSVHIAPDAYIRYLLASQLAAEGHLFRARQQIKQTLAKLKALEHAGARVSILGQLGINPYRQRFHQKFTIIDDEVYCGGGVNLSKDSFDLTDYMLHTTNGRLGDVLASQLDDIIEHSVIDDFSHKIGSEATLFIDGGRPHHSVIYDRATALAQEAKNILFISQFCPSGKLAQVLKAKNAICYFNRPLQLSGPSIASQIVDQTRSQVKNYYKKPAYIHAKCILYEMPDGQKTLLSGSHNFSKRGVDYGTKELAIESSNTALWDELAQFSDKYIR